MVILLLFLMVPDVHSFDGHRKGFLLGFGAGPGVWYDLRLRPGANWGIHSDFKIGLGLNDRVLLHYTGKQFWHDITEGTLGDVYTIIQPSIGISYYSKPVPPSLFGAAGLGYSSHFAGEGTPIIRNSLCVHAGIGYELISHWNLEFDAIYNAKPEVFNLALTFNVLAY